VAERVTISVGLERNTHRFSSSLPSRLLLLLQDGPPKLTNAPDRLREDYPVELQVEVLAQCQMWKKAIAGFHPVGLLVGSGAGSRFDHALISHRALFVKAVHERTWRNYLSLRTITGRGSFPFFIGRVDVVQEHHVELVGGLAATEAENLHDIARLQTEMVHRAQLEILLLCQINSVLHFVH